MNAVAQPAGSAFCFRQLHTSGLLVLPNAWDAGTARLIESLGAKAIATTSAAVAWSHGFSDGEVLPVRLLTATVESIARVVRVPLSVDVEGGYSTDAATVSDLVASVIDAGAVGINLEDGNAVPGVLCAKIESVKRAAARRRVDLFVNARTDVYLRGLAPADRRVAETLSRAEQYWRAGADGIFVPGLTGAVEIRRVDHRQRCPRAHRLAQQGLSCRRSFGPLVRRLPVLLRAQHTL
jgi:2-methylisocitrate lyase-like PEP mutase family enzyme